MPAPPRRLVLAVVVLPRAAALAGTTWEIIAVAYDASAGLVGASGVVQLHW